MDNMKNIHLIPTDKPSRLSILNSGKLDFGAEIMSSSNSKPQHIYITSDESIEEGDWVLFMIDEITEIVKVTTIVNNAFDSKEGFGYGLEYCKKIILTTDQDLIKDGVQAIGDTFLEWFVKNPSCEYVEVEKQMLCDYCGQEHCDNLRCRGYKDSVWYEIIIPQEESKQERICNCGLKESEHNVRHPFIPRQETLEEAAMSYLDKTYSLSYEKTTWQKLHEKTFAAGAKWQAERMYSEKEVLELLRKSHFVEQNIEEWFEQHKKK